MNPWVLLGAVCAAFLTFIGGYTYGQHVQDLETKAKLLTQTQQAREKEQEDKQVITALREFYAQETQRLNRRLYATLDELRNRPERLPEPAREACKGATGAELSEPDGRFLAWFAAEAARVANELSECHAWIDQVEKRDVSR